MMSELDEITQEIRNQVSNFPGETSRGFLAFLDSGNTVNVSSARYFALSIEEKIEVLAKIYFKALGKREAKSLNKLDSMCEVALNHKGVVDNEGFRNVYNFLAKGITSETMEECTEYIKNNYPCIMIIIGIRVTGKSFQHQIQACKSYKLKDFYSSEFLPDIPFFLKFDHGCLNVTQQVSDSDLNLYYYECDQINIEEKMMIKFNNITIKILKLSIEKIEFVAYSSQGNQVLINFTKEGRFLRIDRNSQNDIFRECQRLLDFKKHGENWKMSLMNKSNFFVPLSNVDRSEQEKEPLQIHEGEIKKFMTETFEFDLQLKYYN
jgi:hypothetical protein